MKTDDPAQYWKTIVDTMADGLMIVDDGGGILSVNDAMAAMTGYEKAELIGKTCQIFDCDTCATTRSEGDGQYCALFRDEEIRKCRCTLHKKGGDPLYVMKNASVLKDENGRAVGAVETFSDLSEAVIKENVICDLRRELSQADGFHGMIGDAPVMRQTFDLIASAAQSDAPVIIYGESGTGKELVAQAIHNSSPRKDGPFIKVHCAALNESLLESELFGHVKGAFTGAERHRTGRFEAANTGNIFLDEIGEIPLATQVKLLRVLQEKEIERVGDNQPIPIDVRIISATNKDLKALIGEGRFREDLYYRIGVIPVCLPPLRERREDIPRLVNAFINRIRLKTGKQITGMSDATLARLNAYAWPGNVRELINVIEYAFVICSDDVIAPAHLPRHVFEEGNVPEPPLPAPKPRPEKTDDGGARERLIAALQKAGGNKAEAARLLGLSRMGVYKQLKRFDIRVDKRIGATSSPP